MVSNYAAFYSGNFIASLSALENVLKRINVAVTYVFPKNAPFSNWGEDGKYLKHHDVRTSDFNPEALASALREIVDDGGAVIHMHFICWRALIALKKALRGRKCSLIFQEHMRVNFVEEAEKRGVLRLLKAHLKTVLYRCATSRCRLIGVSDAVYHDLCDIRRRKDDVYLVRNAIDTARLEGARDNALSLAPMRDVAIFGTHFERKGVDIAFNAVKKTSGLRLVVLTHREKEAVDKLNAVDEEWDKYAVVKHVVEDVASVYDHSLCFISPSRSEAFGYAVVEAAYSDTQVIASDIPGQNSMKCIPGIQWVHSEDIDGLAEALINCYEMRKDRLEELDKLKERQKEYIQKNFGVDKWCKEIIRVYGIV